MFLESVVHLCRRNFCIILTSLPACKTKYLT